MLFKWFLKNFHATQFLFVISSVTQLCFRGSDLHVPLYLWPTVNYNKGVFHTHFNKSMHNRPEQHKWSHRSAGSAALWLCVKCAQACWLRCRAPCRCERNPGGHQSEGVGRIATCSCPLGVQVVKGGKRGSTIWARQSRSTCARSQSCAQLSRKDTLTAIKGCKGLLLGVLCSWSIASRIFHNLSELKRIKITKYHHKTNLHKHALTTRNRLNWQKAV